VLVQNLLDYIIWTDYNFKQTPPKALQNINIEKSKKGLQSRKELINKHKILNAYKDSSNIFSKLRTLLSQ
jgi:hypothetical protein